MERLGLLTSSLFSVMAARAPPRLDWDRNQSFGGYRRQSAYSLQRPHATSLSRIVLHLVAIGETWVQVVVVCAQFTHVIVSIMMHGEITIA